MPKGVYKRKHKSMKERLLKKYEVDEDTKCWNWTGAMSAGYGVMAKGRAGEGLIGAHRVSYEVHIGDIEDGQQVCHRCHNPRCINPDHLYAGTRSENQMDRVNDGTSNRGERHGGSKLTEDDVREIRSSKLGSTTTSRQYDVSVELIRRIRNRDLWGWLE